MKILLRHRTITLEVGATQRWLATLALLLLLSAASMTAHAQAFASGTLSFTNPQVQLSSGSLQLLGPWNISAFSQAQNSLGEYSALYTSGSSPGSFNADAVVTYASTHADASAPGDPADFNLSGHTFGQVDLPTFTSAQALGIELATLSNSFVLTATPGIIDVTFSVDIAGNLFVSTGPTGLLAQIASSFTLELDGVPILFWSDFLSVGPNASASLAFTHTLSATVSVSTGVQHTLVFQADPEPQGITSVPESSSVALLLPALGVLAVGRRLRRRSVMIDQTTIGD